MRNAQCHFAVAQRAYCAQYYRRCTTQQTMSNSNSPLTADVERLTCDIISLLQSGRFDLSTEKALQRDIETLLAQRNLPFKREHRLSPEDVPDFIVEPGVVIECKIRGRHAKMAIYKQLQRYAQHEGVLSIILASNVSMGLPPAIGSTPIYAASLSRGWL